ncbi:helix-turn-helix domain-containing protein [Halalkalibacter akibai]
MANTHDVTNRKRNVVSTAYKIERAINGGKSMRIEDLEDVLTVKDIAKFLGISRAKAYELANSDEFRTIRVGSRILIPKSSLLKWLKGETDH